MWLAAVIAALAKLLWPIAAIIIAIGFKPEILTTARLLVSRGWRFKGFGVEAEIAAEQQKSVETVVSDPTKIELKEIPGLSRTAAMSNLEKALHAQLATIAPEAQIDVLVRNLAQAQLEASFGIIYSNIFGSQIAGLVQLSARRIVTVDEARSFFHTEAEQKYPQIYANYRFADWLRYLMVNSLVTQVGLNVAITPLGDDFLLWLRGKNLYLNKIG